MNSNPEDRLLCPESHNERSRWFVGEVQPHEPKLRGYLSGAFPDLRDVDDVVQESFLRVWKARMTHRITFAKAFLFKVARHAALDVIRHNGKSPIDREKDLAMLPNPEDSSTVALIEERLELLSEVIARLPDRRREIVVLRKIKRLSQKETAARLGLSERTVENQLFRAMKQCRSHLQALGINDLFGDER